MIKTSTRLLVLLPIALSDLAVAQLWESETHRVELASRARMAHLEEDNTKGKAGSLLLRLNLHSRWTDNIATLLELDHVETFLEDDHSDAVRMNGKPVIPDPPGTEINQLFADYQGDIVHLRTGRQRINFDNQRFIGSGSFWQNEQTFDALLAQTNIFSSSSMTYVYVVNVNRIFGDGATARLSDNDIVYGASAGERPVGLLGDHKLNAHLARLEINEWDYTRLTAYTYLIDNQDARNLSNNTAGIKYHFSYKVSAIKYRADLEAAVQTLQESDDDLQIPYYLADLGLGIGSFEFGGRYEILGSKKNMGFITPLGSVHEYQGWADKFVTTPDAGIVDASIRVNWRIHPWRIDARYHFFDEDAGQQRYGEEFDLDIAFKPWRKHELLLRYADFRSSTDYRASLSDEKKLILSYSYNL